MGREEEVIEDDFCFLVWERVDCSIIYCEWKKCCFESRDDKFSKGYVNLGRLWDMKIEILKSISWI